MPMAVTPFSDAAMSAAKMARLQPARRPSAPMKIFRIVEGLEIGGVGPDVVG